MDGAKVATGWIGRAMVRREDARLLSGQGRFVADLAPPDCLHLVFLRSPHAQGNVGGLDVSGASDAALILTGDDFAACGKAAVNPLVAGARAVPMEPLAVGRVRAVGQAIAAVVAATALQAQDLAEAIILEIDETSDGPSDGGNDERNTRAAGDAEVLRHVTCRDSSDETASDAAGSVSARVDHALVAPFALEPRAALADWDGTRLTCWLSTQTPQRCRDDLANILGLPRDAVHVIAPDVGGAFGGKASLMPEDAVVAMAAMRLGRAVLWQATRSEEFQAATQGRGTSTEGRMTLDAAGRITGLSASFQFSLGHWMPYSALAPTRNALRMLPGPYAIGSVRSDVSAALTNTSAVNIYRGAGRPEVVILLERLMDKAAQATGADPLAFRRAHLGAPGPLAGGDRVCSGDYAGLLDRIAPDYSDWCASQIAQRASGAVTGIGLALYVEPCGIGWESAEARLMADGSIVAATGSSAQGQGRETAFAQLVAHELRIDPARVRVIQGDTGEIPEGIGALASRSTAIGGSAMVVAARALLEQAKAAAGPLLNAAPEDVLLADGLLTSPQGAQIGWADLAARIGGTGAVLVARERYTAPAEAWASGAVLAQVTIESDTGTLRVDRIMWADDAGAVVNPMLVEGQMIGGLAQGLGATLSERVVYEDGQLLTGSLMDYAVPRAADMPPLRLISHPTRSPANVLGAKGVGEAGCIGVPAAILNATMNALGPDAPDLSLPLTPEKLWRAMNGMPL